MISEAIVIEEIKDHMSNILSVKQSLKEHISKGDKSE